MHKYPAFINCLKKKKLFHKLSNGNLVESMSHDGIQLEQQAQNFIHVSQYLHFPKCIPSYQLRLILCFKEKPTLKDVDHLQVLFQLMAFLQDHSGAYPASSPLPDGEHDTCWYRDNTKQFYEKRETSYNFWKYWSSEATTSQFITKPCILHTSIIR